MVPQDDVILCDGPEYVGSTHASGACRPGSIPGGPTENVSYDGLSYNGSTHGWGSCSLGPIPRGGSVDQFGNCWFVEIVMQRYITAVGRMGRRLRWKQEKVSSILTLLTVSNAC